MNAFKPPAVAQAPASPPPPVPVVAMATDKRPQKKPMTPTFLSEAFTPGAASGGGGKTMLGA